MISKTAWLDQEFPPLPFPVEKRRRVRAFEKGKSIQQIIETPASQPDQWNHRALRLIAMIAGGMLGLYALSQFFSKNTSTSFLQDRSLFKNLIKTPIILNPQVSIIDFSPDEKNACIFHENVNKTNDPFTLSLSIQSKKSGCNSPLLYYNNGDVYAGPIGEDGKPSGIGYAIIHLEEGLFTGPVKNGEPHGENGKIMFNDGSTYRGGFLHGKMDRGLIQNSKGDIYEGKYIGSDRIDFDECFISFFNGSAYNGSCKNREAYGSGRFFDTNDDVYEGTFKDGHKVDGPCTLLYNTDFFVGDCKDGKPDGFGSFRNKNGDVYQGNFKEGYKVDGPCTLVYENGRPPFSGECKDGKPFESLPTRIARFVIEWLFPYS